MVAELSTTINRFVNSPAVPDIITQDSERSSNGANLAPQLIRIDFAVFPETKSQGLFHQIQKEVTFCGLPHGADA